MEANQPQNLTPKTVMKRFLIMLVCTILFALVLEYFLYGRITSAILIGFAIVVPIMIVSTIIGFKYRASIVNLKNNFWYFFLILGIMGTLLNLVLVFLEGSDFNYYLQIGVGLVVVVYSIYKIKNAP